MWLARSPNFAGAIHIYSRIFKSRKSLLDIISDVLYIYLVAKLLSSILQVAIMFIPPKSHIDPILGHSIDVAENRFKLQWLAKKLAPKDHRIHVCFQGVRESAEGVEVRQKIGGNPYFSGTWVCNNRWVCPVCGEKIATRNRKEIRRAHQWAESEQYQTFMLTLTAGYPPHWRLRTRLDAFNKAKTLLTQRASWRALGQHLAGSIARLDVVFSRSSGWGPHQHIDLFIKDLSADQAAEMLVAVKRDWVKCLQECGLSFCEESGNISISDQQAADYFTKDYDLINKSAGQRLAPFEVLKRAGCSGPGWAWAREAWSEFVQDIKGVQCIRFSRNLKESLGLTDEDEEEEKGDDDNSDKNDQNVITSFDRNTWSAIVYENNQQKGKVFAGILKAANFGNSAVCEYLYWEFGIIPIPPQTG